jgi:hypothetical protein
MGWRWRIVIGRVGGDPFFPLSIQLLVDDLLVFTGTMPATPTHARGILPTLQAPVDPFIVTFSDTDTIPEDGETREG